MKIREKKTISKRGNRSKKEKKQMNMNQYKNEVKAGKNEKKEGDEQPPSTSSLDVSVGKWLKLRSYDLYPKPNKVSVESLTGPNNNSQLAIEAIPRYESQTQVITSL